VRVGARAIDDNASDPGTGQAERAASAKTCMMPVSQPVDHQYMARTDKTCCMMQQRGIGGRKAQCNGGSGNAADGDNGPYHGRGKTAEAEVPDGCRFREDGPVEE